jgi:hypothetical protein
MHVEYDDVRTQLPGVIALKGEEFVYTPVQGQCVYVNDEGAPSCLIGYYLADLGVPTSVFDELDGSYNYLEIDTVISHGLLDEWVTFSQDAIDALVEVQSGQDCFLSWGKSYSDVFEPTEDDK